MQNHYLDKRSTFMEPEVTQYGGAHMVMSNVMKEVKTRYVNIDTRFARDLPQPGIPPTPVSNYTIDFPERVQKARSISVANVELPLSFFNVSQQLGNNTFVITTTDNVGNTTPYTFTIPDGLYGLSSANPTGQILDIILIISTDISNSPIQNDVSLNFTSSQNNFGATFIYTNTNINITDFSIQFDVDKNGVADRYNLKSKLGWMLGFRKQRYSMADFDGSGLLNSEALIDLIGPRYVYLAVDEFSNHAPQSSFVSMLPRSILNKNILARVSIISNQVSFITTFMTLEIASIPNGLLISDTREYTDDIDLQRLNVQLVDEYGRNIDLNGLDFSFTLVVKHT